MPRKAKVVQAELLPPEDQSQKGRKKLVEAEHTIKYSAPVPVAIEEVEEETEGEDLEFAEVEETTSRRRKKTAKDEREELRREMEKYGSVSASRLKLSIDKYRHSDSDDSGTLAEKDFCTKYAVTKDHILSDDYLDVARKYGPGRYWFTLRMDNKIVRQWERAINGAVVASPTSLPSSPVDPTSPPVIYQTVEGQQAGTMPTLKDFMKAQREALKEQLEMAKLMREAYGLTPEQPQQQPKSEEEVLAGALLTRPEVIDNVVGSVLKRFGGKAGESSSDPWAEVAMELVKTGQAAQVVKELVNGVFNGFGSFFPGRQNNGQTQMGAPALANQGQTEIGRTQGQPDRNQGSMGQAEINAASTPVLPPGETQSPPSPEEQALAFLIDHCRQNIPARIAFNRLINFADAVNEQAPHLSIDGYIDMLGSAPTDAVIEYVKTLPGGAEIAALPHAKEWTAELQRLIKESQEGEES